MSREFKVVYIAARLPTRSETFVYRELFALRREGCGVMAASVRAPEHGLGSKELENLAQSALIVYKPQTFIKGIIGSAYHLPVTAMVLRDMFFGQGLSLRARGAILVQGLAGLGLAAMLREDGIDHIHAHMANTPTSIAMYAAAALGCPFSFTGHAADLFRDRVLLIEKLKRASFTACISHWHRSFYQGLYKTDDRYLPIVRCGVDTDEFVPATFDGSTNAKESSEIVRLLCVGRLVPKKGVNYLINALSSIIAQHAGSNRSLPKLSVTIVGDGPERKHLETMVKKYGLTKNVEFLGAQPNRVVRDLMRNCNLFVLPCVQADDGDKDGIPVVLMEAMSSKVCVISGNIPSIKELIEDGVHGRLLDAANSTKLAEAITGLVQDSSIRQNMANAGRKRIEEEFSADLNISRLINAIEASHQEPLNSHFVAP